MKKLLCEVKCWACGNAEIMVFNNTVDLFMYSKCSRCMNSKTFKPISIIDNDEESKECKKDAPSVTIG